MYKLDKLVAWLVVSSANPDRFSMTLKGVLLQYVGIALVVCQLLGVPLVENQLVTFVSDFSVIAGLFLSLFGVARKLYYTLKSM